MMVEKILSYRDFISREKIIFKQTFSSVHSFHKVSNNLKKKLIKTNNSKKEISDFNKLV